MTSPKASLSWILPSRADLTSVPERTRPASRRSERRRCAPAVHRGVQHGRGAGERAPVRRDAAPAEGDRAPLVRAGRDQQHPAGHGSGARLPVHRRPGRRQAARAVRHRRHEHPLARRDTNLVHRLYIYEHGKRLALAADEVQARASSPRRCRRARRSCCGTGAEVEAMGIKTTPGTDTSLCSVFLPIFVGDRVARLARARELRARRCLQRCGSKLLSTVASSMGVALENARLLEERSAARASLRRWPRSGATCRRRWTSPP